MKFLLKIFNSLLLANLFFTFSVTTLASPSVALVVEEREIPEDFEFVGVYRIESITRVRAGKTIQSEVKEVSYSVYSNLQEIRLYQGNDYDSYHTYKIYRADGITLKNSDGTLLVHPGIQASHITNHTVKQLSLTQNRLTITQLPPLSDTVVICFAKRLIDPSSKR